VVRRGFEPVSVKAEAGKPSNIRLALAVLKQSVDVNGQSDPLSTRSIESADVDRNELRTISNDTGQLIEYAKAVAGVPFSDQQVYVDTLPAQELPPAEMISRISVNADPFSAEYSDGDLTHIDVTTKPGEERFHFNLGGISFGTGAHSPLAPAGAASKDYSRLIGLSGPLGIRGLSFSAQASAAYTESTMPAVVSPNTLVLLRPFVRDLVSPTANHSLFGTFAIYYDTEASATRFFFSQSRTTGANIGAGGLTLADTAGSSAIDSHELRLTTNRTLNGLILRAGMAYTSFAAEWNANSESLGLVVPGVVIAGGSAMSHSISDRDSWTMKTAVEPKDNSSNWLVGFTLTGTNISKSDVPNPLGTAELTDLESLQSFLSADGPAEWSQRRGNGRMNVNTLTAGLFAQKEIVKKRHLLITAGGRVDVERGYGFLLSPRLSLAAEWKGFVFRTGTGLFAQNISADILARNMEGDPNHLVQLISPSAEFWQITNRDTPAAQIIQNESSPDLRMAREVITKASLERKFGAMVVGAEVTVSRDRHLLGSVRLNDALGWMNILESNRSADQTRLHLQVSRNWKRLSLRASYEKIRAYDNTDGPFSFPLIQNDLHDEWAPSANIPRDIVSGVANWRLPGQVTATFLTKWHGPAPYNITTGLDTQQDLLFNGRGGRPRNSGNGPAYSSVDLFLYRRFALPSLITHGHKTFLDVGLRALDLLGTTNYVSFDPVIGSPGFGRPVSAYPGRSFRIWMNVD
jgi:hypothetical protein